MVVRGSGRKVATFKRKEGGGVKGRERRTAIQAKSEWVRRRSRMKE